MALCLRDPDELVPTKDFNLARKSENADGGGRGTSGQCRDELARHLPVNLSP